MNAGLREMILDVLDGHTKSMANYSAVGNNLGVPEEDYKAVADECEVRNAKMAPRRWCISIDESGVRVDHTTLVVLERESGQVVWAQQMRRKGAEAMKKRVQHPSSYEEYLLLSEKDKLRLMKQNRAEDMIRCKECMHWKKDKNGGWGVCMNMMTAQDVEHWKYQESLTFETFGCIYARKEGPKP
jgi:hypothetical protein